MIFQCRKEKQKFNRKKVILVQESTDPSTLAVLQTISFLQIPAFTGTEHSTHKKVTSIGTRLLEWWWWWVRGNLRIQMHSFSTHTIIFIVLYTRVFLARNWPSLQSNDALLRVICVCV